MFRNMVTSLLKYDRIQTTDVRAKEVSRWADHIITLAKRGDLHAVARRWPSFAKKTLSTRFLKRPKSASAAGKADIRGLSKLGAGRGRCSYLHD